VTVRIISSIIATILILSALITGFLAYFITTVDKHNQLYDGLGRHLTESPLFIRFIFGQDRLWAGWGWFAIDMVVFFGVIALSQFFLKIAFKDSNS
jgi:hypothetical protein